MPSVDLFFSILIVFALLLLYLVVRVLWLIRMSTAARRLIVAGSLGFSSFAAYGELRRLGLADLDSGDILRTAVGWLLVLCICLFAGGTIWAHFAVDPDDYQFDLPSSKLRIYALAMIPGLGLTLFGIVILQPAVIVIGLLAILLLVIVAWLGSDQIEDVRWCLALLNREVQTDPAINRAIRRDPLLRLTLSVLAWTVEMKRYGW